MSEPKDDIDWAALVEQYQRENEALRMRVGVINFSRSFYRSQIDISGIFKQAVSWADAHPMSAALLVYVISTVIMDVFQVVTNRQ